MDIWNTKVESSSQRLLLLCLNDNKDEYSKCSLPVSKLSELTLLNRKTIMKVLDELEVLGLIKFTGDKVGAGIKVYELLFVNSEQKCYNVTNDNMSLWNEWMEIRKTKGCSPLSKQDITNVTNEITEAMKATSDSFDDVLSLIVSRQWKWFKAEWYVSAKHTKQARQTKHSDVNPTDEIKQAYLDATQSIFKTPLSLAVAKKLGEYEVRTIPEKYIYHKWVSAYNELSKGGGVSTQQNKRLQQNKQLLVSRNSAKIASTQREIADDKVVTETLLNIKRIIGRVK